MSLVCRLSCGRTQEFQTDVLGSWDRDWPQHQRQSPTIRPAFALRRCAVLLRKSHTRRSDNDPFRAFYPPAMVPRLHPGALIAPTPFIPPSPRDPARPRAIPSDPERSRAIPSDPEDRERELGNTASDALTTVPDLIARDDETPTRSLHLLRSALLRGRDPMRRTPNPGRSIAAVSTHLLLAKSVGRCLVSRTPCNGQ